MLQTLSEIFKTKMVEKPNGEKIKLHSNTSIEQGLFLQKRLQIFWKFVDLLFDKNQRV